MLLALTSAGCLSQGFVPSATAQTVIPFDTLHWDLSQAKQVTHLDREAVTGTALLRDVVFSDGTIEVDIATLPDTRSYPAVIFREQDAENYERIYLRPHRSHFYQDALQYAPSFHGVDSWQLYNGPGKTNALEIMPGEWNHLKIIVAGDRAEVYWNREEDPALVIDHLDHGLSEGAVKLMSSQTGSAFYAGFSCRRSDTLKLPPAAPAEPVCGIISHWELSSPYPLLKVDQFHYPSGELLRSLSWQPVEADAAGLVDISRYYGRKSRAGDCVMARTTLHADRDTLLLVGFGYSDYLFLYLNQRPLFSGNSSYRSRDDSFLGIVGYNDFLFLPLKQGENELAVQVGEAMGGWGFCFRRDQEVCLDRSVKKLFTLTEGISVPEAVIYDPLKDVCYVANYFNEGKESLSKISPDGTLLEAKWVTGVQMPTGMCLAGDTLYSVTRTGITVIDTREGKILEMIPLPGVKSPNDVAVDGEGTLYISDTPGNTVFRYTGGSLEPFLGPDLLESPNALHVEGEFLLVGEKERLVSVSLSEKSIRTLATLEREANVDGIQPDGRGNLLISDYHGKLYLLDPDGSKELLINSATSGEFIADFAFVPATGLILAPTLTRNSVVGYKIRYE